MDKELEYIVHERIRKLNGIVSILKQQPAIKEIGSLRVSRDGNAFKYYQLKNKGDRNGEYLRKDNMDTIIALAQKGYNEKALELAENELKYLWAFINKYPSKNADHLYDSLSEGRKALVKPVWQPDEEYVRQWLSQEYNRLGFSPHDTSEFITNAGIRVRSKSEVLIANTLEKFNIPFLIELPYYLDGAGWVNPDFSILVVRERRVKIWEHHGMLDDRDYRENNFLKKNAAYLSNGFFPGDNLIQTFESQKTPLSIPVIELIIRKYLL